jgi:hypothetical protein
MSNPQITGRTRPGPTEALRAVFSGIGRILMAADKRADKGQRPAASPPAAEELRWRSLDQTGNVRLLTAEDTNDGNADVKAAAHGVPALPLANYDTLSLASIRARLRTLDVAQLRTLLDYEATHAERPDVLGMLERRIEKLETGG